MALGNIGEILGLLDNPKIKQFLPAILALIAFLESKFDKKPAPTAPVTVPTPAGGEPDFPDDTIPTPAATRTVASARLKLSRAQYNRQRFPEMYTPDNPMGLYPQSFLREVEAGTKALNYGSKAWFDLTAYDAGGKEFLRDAVLSHGLAFKTEHHVGDAFIKGGGIGPDGEPMPWEQNDTDAVGNGITAWKSSLGFLHQVKFHDEGTFECSGSIAGVQTNRFTVRVS